MKNILKVMALAIQILYESKDIIVGFSDEWSH